jgi:hypothetical protein
MEFAAISAGLGLHLPTNGERPELLGWAKAAQGLTLHL